MSLPQLDDLRRDVMREERHLTWVANQHGKDSTEYKEALKKFARVWFVLKMTHKHEEFLGVMTTPDMPEAEVVPAGE